jgi:TP901 family phage tail tape measure protein
MSVRTDVVNLIVNVGGDKAQNELNQLRKKSADLNAEMKALHKNTTEYKNKAAELKVVDTQMASLRKQIGLTALSQKELTSELKRLQQLKNITTPQSKEFHELQNQINAVNIRLYEVKNGVFGFGASMHKVKAEIKQFGMLALSYLGFEFITDQFKQIISGAGKLSDQLADLQRVAGLTAAEANNLNQGLRALDTRTSGESLRQIAIIAGKLGVAKDDILDFTKAVDMLVVSLGDELGDADQITTQLGKILNVFDGGVNGQNITTLGNAVVELANAGVASGGFITDFTQRVAGIAKASNLSLGATVGLAAGFEELGLRSESSSTALQKLLSTIATDTPKAAKIAGMPLAEFNKLFAEAPQQALIKYAQGLVKNKASFSEIATSFKDAGEEGARIIATLQAIGQRGEFLSEKIALGTKAIQENSAITEAYRLKNENLGATLDKIGKRLSAWFTSSGFMKGITDIITGFGKMIGAVKSADTALEQFQKQSEKVMKLENEMMPLLDRYDELKSKTSLSKDEQVELNKAIQIIASTIPSAITQFNEYGKAIGISTERAREFIRTQQLILKEKNREALRDRQQELSNLEKQKRDQQNFLNTNKKQLEILQQSKKALKDRGFEDPGGKIDKEIEMWSNGMLKISASLQAIEERMTGVKGWISELNGDSFAKALEGGGATSNSTDTSFTNTATGLSDSEIKKQDAAFEKLKALRDKIIANREELEAAGMNADDRELRRIHKKYAALLIEAIGHAAEIVEIKKLEQQEILQYTEAHNAKLEEEEYYLAVERKRIWLETQAALKKALNDAMASHEQAAEDEIELEQRKATEKIANDAEAKAEQRKQNEENYKIAISALNDFLGATQNLLMAASDLATTRENAELNAYLDANEKKKKSLDKLLNGKRISQSKYDQEMAKLDKEAAARKYDLELKQFKRQQSMAYTNAIMNAAQGISAIWAQWGAFPIVAGILTGIAAIATGIQIATIASQKPPTARKGLVVGGPSHEEGGINMVDNRTGNTLAEIEGGEPVMVLSKSTYGNNRGLIDSLLYSSQHRNGASVMPNWATRSPSLNSNIIPMMEKGGVWSMNSGAGGNSSGNVEQLLAGLNNHMQQMVTYMAYMPSKLKAEVVLQDINDANTMMDTIKRESGLQQTKQIAA